MGHNIPPYGELRCSRYEAKDTIQGIVIYASHTYVACIFIHVFDSTSLELVCTWNMSLSTVAWIQNHAVHKVYVHLETYQPTQESCKSADGVEMVHGEEWL